MLKLRYTLYLLMERTAQKNRGKDVLKENVPKEKFKGF
jgi:hypothetical protein